MIQAAAFLLVGCEVVVALLTSGTPLGQSGGDQVQQWARNSGYSLEKMQARPHMLGVAAFDKRQCFEATVLDEHGNRHELVLRVGSAAFGPINSKVEVLERRQRS